VRERHSGSKQRDTVSNKNSCYKPRRKSTSIPANIQSASPYANKSAPEYVVSEIAA
jgi:hypothetical protein